jgi:hypothetical protein
MTIDSFQTMFNKVNMFEEKILFFADKLNDLDKYLTESIQKL